MSCGVCATKLKSKHFCADCLDESVKDKNIIINTLLKKISSNEILIHEKLVSQQENHKTIMKNMQITAQSKSIQTKLDQIKLSNDQLAVKNRILEADLKKRRDTFEMYKSNFESYKSKDKYETTVEKLPSDLDSLKILVKRRSQAIPLYFKQFPIICEDKKMIIFDSMEMSIGNTWMVESLPKDLNIMIGNLVFFVMNLCKIVGVSLPYQLSYSMKPSITVGNTEYELWLKDDEIAFKNAISWFNKDVLYLCDQCGVFVTLENQDNFRVNLLSLRYHPNLYL
jgi:hypothetical protein